MTLPSPVPLWIAPRAKTREMKRLCGVVTALAAFGFPLAHAATVTLVPVQDNTIYSENSNFSNGTGDLFAGVTNQATIRRALVQFDIAGSIPAGAVVSSVSLTLKLTRVNVSNSANFTLNPLLASWGEGNSYGTGFGDQATLGDATWTYRTFNTNLWDTAGGSFGHPSGTTSIGTSVGTSYSFPSTSEMVSDVQGWADNPASNFGWILQAEDEDYGGTSARSFGSSESSISDQPTLTVTYSIPEPRSLVLLSFALTASLVHRRRAW